MIMVEVFKTNVAETSEANKLKLLLLDYFPHSRINFDLEDCDRILRVEGEKLVPVKVVRVVKEHGYECEVLE
jgi:hypothetical protein